MNNAKASITVTQVDGELRLEVSYEPKLEVINPDDVPPCWIVIKAAEGYIDSMMGGSEAEEGEPPIEVA